MNKITHLSETSHIRKRMGMYLSSPTYMKENIYLYENNNFIKKEVKYVPALIKAVSEVLDNSVDEAIRENLPSNYKIKLEIDEKSFRVIDNGKGIPVEKNEEDIYYPKLAWGYARTSGNYEDDENRITMGLNGFGIFAVNSIVLYFKGISQDGKNKIVCEWRNGADPDTYKQKITKSSKTGVEVYVEPDFSLFDSNQFTETDFKIIKTRLVMLKLTYPEIKFYFNGEQITQPKDFEF